MFAADPIVNLLSETIWLSLAILWIRCLSKTKALGWKPPSSCHKVWKMWLNKQRQFLLSVNTLFFFQSEIVSLYGWLARLAVWMCILMNFQNFSNLENLSHFARVVLLHIFHCSNDQNNTTQCVNALNVRVFFGGGGGVGLNIHYCSIVWGKGGGLRINTFI